MNTRTLHECLRAFPGAALELSADGIVVASNGRLDALVGSDLAGVAFAGVLDPTSQAKWERILTAVEPMLPACISELVLTTPTSLELKSFMVIRGGAGADAALWLLEYASDPKLNELYAELSELNRDLVQTHRDLSQERARLRSALDRSEMAVRSRDQVLAVVSHDLRNPLNTIMAAASLLEMNLQEEKSGTHLEIIKRAAASMSRLISDLLDVNAIESGSLAVERRPFRLAALLEEARRSFEAAAADRQQRLTLSAPDDVIVNGDPHRLGQVLSNLIGNATKFTPPDGAVTVTATVRGDDVVVDVRDTGPGIAPVDLPHVFDRYWHAQRSRKGGAGLGLAIAKGIVEAHGGKIWVVSEVDAGSCFAFSIPLTGSDTESTSETR